MEPEGNWIAEIRADAFDEVMQTGGTWDEAEEAAREAVVAAGEFDPLTAWYGDLLSP